MFSTRKTDAAFFAAFENHAGKSVEAAKMLVDIMHRMKPALGEASGIYRATGEAVHTTEIDSETMRLYAAIKEAETTADSITHETVKRLHENWITPLDRDDIHNLITRMDDVLDLIEAVADRVVLFQVTVAPPEAAELAELLLQSCEAMAKAISMLDQLKHAPQILAMCVEVNRLENAADNVHRRAMADLFRPGNDPLTVMKWRDIFDGLESATDRCEDVANILEGVVLEYA